MQFVGSIHDHKAAIHLFNYRFYTADHANRGIIGDSDGSVLSVCVLYCRLMHGGAVMTTGMAASGVVVNGAKFTCDDGICVGDVVGSAVGSIGIGNGMDRIASALFCAVFVVV